MQIVFDLTKLHIKLFISFIFIIIFFVIYRLINSKELGHDQISNYDLFYYTLLNHMGIHHSHFLDAKTTRAKFLVIIQLIIGYSIFIL